MFLLKNWCSWSPIFCCHPPPVFQKAVGSETIWEGGPVLSSCCYNSVNLEPMNLIFGTRSSAGHVNQQLFSQIPTCDEVFGLDLSFFRSATRNHKSGGLLLGSFHKYSISILAAWRNVEKSCRFSSIYGIQLVIVGHIPWLRADSNLASTGTLSKGPSISKKTVTLIIYRINIL